MGSASQIIKRVPQDAPKPLNNILIINNINNMAKRVLSITIDEKLLEKWKKHVEKECINSSQLIEKVIVEYLKKRGKNA